MSSFEVKGDNCSFSGIDGRVTHVAFYGSNGHITGDDSMRVNGRNTPKAVTELQALMFGLIDEMFKNDTTMSIDQLQISSTHGVLFVLTEILTVEDIWNVTEPGDGESVDFQQVDFFGARNITVRVMRGGKFSIVAVNEAGEPLALI